MAGKIYLTATPIGNLDDITIRALNILKDVDFIAAEDTRQTLKLLNHYEIKKPLVSYHEHNKIESGPKIIERVLNGESVAVVTDAGTPGISDPGADLVKLAVESGIEVFGVPGAVAGIYALIVSGLDTSRFVFEGFIKREGRERKEILEELKNEKRTMIFYEAPHRLSKTLMDFYNTFGRRKCAVCRELTKIHEEILRSNLEDAANEYAEREPRGEYVIVVEGKPIEEIQDERKKSYENMTIEEHIKKYISQGMTKKEAVKAVAQEREISKSEVYKYSINI